MSSLTQVLTALRRSLVIVLLCAAIGLAGGVALASNTEPAHRATASVFIEPRDTTAILLGSNETAVDADRKMSNAASIATSPEVLRNIAAALDLPSEDWKDVQESLTVETQPQTNILRLSFAKAGAAGAVEGANTSAKVFSTYYVDFVAGQVPAGTDSADIEQRRASLLSISPPARVLSQADRAERTDPGPVRGGAMGLVLGLTLGLLIAAARAALDRKIRSADQARQILPLPAIEVGRGRGVDGLGSIVDLMVMSPPEHRERTLTLLGTGSTEAPWNVAERLSRIGSALPIRVGSVEHVNGDPAGARAASSSWVVNVGPSPLVNPLVRRSVSGSDVVLLVVEYGKTKVAELETLAAELRHWPHRPDGMLLLNEA